MGMYTELVLSVELRKERPANVIPVLTYLINGEGDEPTDLPDHPFFEKRRWRMVGRGSSYYFANPEPIGRLHLGNITKTYHFTMWCNLKNYQGEIEAFCDWLAPYVHTWGREILGWTRYEEEDVPTLIAFGPDGVEFINVPIPAESFG